MNRITQITIPFLLTCSVLIIPKARAVDEKNKNSSKESVDDVLDQLEKKILNEERKQSSMSSSPQSPTDSKNKQSDQNTQNIQMKSTTVQTATPEMEKILDIVQAVNEIESDLDAVSAKVQKAKQNILEESSIQNRVLIDVAIENEKEASLRSVEFKINKTLLYRHDDSSGIWMPVNHLPVYSGSLPPGQHEIEFKALVNLKSGDKPYLHSSNNRSIEQKFQIEVPVGEVDKRWKIWISPSKGSETSSMAKIISVDVK